MVIFLKPAKLLILLVIIGLFFAIKLNRTSTPDKSSTPSAMLAPTIEERVQHLESQVDELDSLRAEVKELHLVIDGLKTPKQEPTPAPQEPVSPLSFYIDRSSSYDPSLGSKDAPVQVWAFLDYQCAPCKSFATKVFPKLLEEYVNKGQIKITVRDYPLSSNKNSKDAAIFARCASEQQKFWQAFRLMFEDTQSVDLADFEHLAAAIPNLDKEKLAACRGKRSYEEIIEKDTLEARRAGASGTPTFFVGQLKDDNKKFSGVIIRGAQPYPVFTHEIEAMLYESRKDKE